MYDKNELNKALIHQLGHDDLENIVYHAQALFFALPPNFPIKKDVEVLTTLLHLEINDRNAEAMTQSDCE